MTHDDTTHEARLQRIDDCRNLYLKYNGKNHELIEREMRELGHADFHRRIMYDRFERGRHRPGWIGSYGFNSLVREQNLRRGVEEERSGGVGEELETTPLPTSFTPPLLHSAKPDLPDFPEFQAWLQTVSPSMEWEWKHQVYIYKRLRRVFDGDCKRLMIFLPPRHGKSELVTVRYAAWCLKQDPSLNVIIGSYNQRLANRFSRKIKRVLTDDAALQTSPEGTNEIARGKAESRDPGVDAIHTSDPVRVEQMPHDVDPLQGANDHGHFPGVACASPTDPGLLHSSPTATRIVSEGDRCDQTSYKNRSVEPDGCRFEPGAAPASMFPFAKQRPANSEAEWETAAGGGLRAVGVGGGVTGFGAGLIIIDDPVKSRAEAESQTFRDNIWDWFNDDLYTRLEPEGKIILIQTRWHEDDLAGRLLREAKEEGGEQWEVISLPAIAESGITNYECRITNEENPEPETVFSDSENSKFEIRNLKLADPLDRLPGEALCPERYNEEALGRLKRKLGSYSFASLYQQHPVPAEGGLFKREWFKNIVSFAPPNLRWFRGYDLGITKGADADYTASLRVAFDRDGTLYIDGGFRKQIEYPEQRRYILGRIETERDTVHGIELSANGHAVIQDLRRERNIQGRAFCGIKVKGTKVSRAVAWIALAEEGRVRLVRGAWNSDFVEEACSFPSGTHDDQIDAVSIAVSMCRRERSRLYTF